MRRRGFTLLEVLVATLLMGIAVAGLMGALRTSLSNAARLTDSARGTALARRQMDELLVIRNLPLGVPLEGKYPPELVGGMDAGWRARVLPFESQAMPGQMPPVGGRMLERIELQVWWKTAGQERHVELSAYRGALIRPADLPAFKAMAVGQ
jgi:general secretion pathway protein I